MSSPIVHDPPETQAAPKVAVYANQFEIGFNAFEFLFDFGQVYDEDATEAHWRVVTAPAYAKVFRALLDKSISEYEEAFGIIPDPQELP